MPLWAYFDNVTALPDICDYCGEYVNHNQVNLYPALQKNKIQVLRAGWVYVTLSSKNKQFTPNFSLKCPTDSYSTMWIVEITNLRKRLQSMWVFLDCVASNTSLGIITSTDAFGKFYTKCSICVLLIWLTVGTFCKLGRTQRQGMYCKKLLFQFLTRLFLSLPFRYLSSIKRTRW